MSNLDIKFDFNSEYSKFISESNESLDNLVKISFENKLFVSLIILDFTFLNSLDKKFGYDPGNLLKKLVLNFITSKSEKYDIVYSTVTSSKIFLFSKKELNLEFNSGLKKFCEDKVKEEFSKNDLKIKKKLENKTLIYVIEKDSISNNYFQIGKYVLGDLSAGNFKSIFLKAYLSENRLNNLRNKLDDYFDNNSNFKSKSKSKDFEEKLLNLLKLNYNLNSTEINNEFNKLKRDDFKNSKYLTEAYDGYEAGHELYYQFILIIKYLIWIQMQELQFIGYKYEKVYLYFNRVHEGNSTSNDFVTLFEEKNDLISWFDTSVEIFSSVMDEADKIEKNEIKQVIVNSNFEDFKQVDEIRNKIQFFFDKFKNPSGLFNIPLERIKPSNYSIQCLKQQFYSNFGEYKNKYNNWINLKDNIGHSIIRNGYYTVIDKSENIYYALPFFNSELFKNQNQLRFHVAFLEIDGFNSMNNVYFPNDSDSILYGKILEILARVNLVFLEKYSSIFNKMITSIGGDEFYFSFVSQKDITIDEEKIFLQFLSKFREEVLKEFSHIKFPESRKIEVNLSGDILVKFRKILFEEKRFIRKNKKVDMLLTEVGITGGVLFNNSYSNFNNFKTIVTELDAKVTGDLKALYKGKISIIDFKGRILKTF